MRLAIERSIITGEETGLSEIRGGVTKSVLGNNDQKLLWDFRLQAYHEMDLFGDIVALFVLYCVSNSYYGMPRRPIKTNLSPENPVIAI